MTMAHQNGVETMADAATGGSHVFLELFSYKASWIELTKAERESIMSDVEMALSELPKCGVEVMAWGLNELEGDLRAPYDFFCVYRVSGNETMRLFESTVASSNWSRHLTEVVVGGAIRDPLGMLSSFAMGQNLGAWKSVS